MKLSAALRRAASVGPRAVAAWVFFVTLALYLSNGRTVGQVDAWPSSLLPIAILVDGRLTVDRLAAGIADTPPPVFIATPRGLVGAYPIATGLLALPIEALPIAIEAAVARPAAAAAPAWPRRSPSRPAAASPSPSARPIR
jgi:hypothetical protein